MRRVLAVLGSALFFVLAPGTVAGLVPWWISRWHFESCAAGWLAVRIMGGLPIAAGSAVLLDSFARFAMQGLGTPAPVFPTRHLVITGLYRYVRNPMYIAVVAIIMGQGLLLCNMKCSRTRTKHGGFAPRFAERDRSRAASNELLCNREMPIRVLLLAGLFADIAVAADGPTITVVRCARLLDVIAGRYLTNANVIISDDTITGVGGTPPPGSRVLDLSSGTCLPGLIDVHDHITLDTAITGYAALGISAHRSTVTGVKNAKITLLAGFTTIRNLGADEYSDVAIRDGIAAGDIDGPRMLVSGPPLGITGGHCDENLLPFEYHRVYEGVADGPWAARTSDHVE